VWQRKALKHANSHKTRFATLIMPQKVHWSTDCIYRAKKITASRNIGDKLKKQVCDKTL
jgi:hypothetical protein